MLLLVLLPDNYYLSLLIKNSQLLLLRSSSCFSHFQPYQSLILWRLQPLANVHSLPTLVIILGDFNMFIDDPSINSLSSQFINHFPLVSLSFTLPYLDLLPLAKSFTSSFWITAFFYNQPFKYAILQPPFLSFHFTTHIYNNPTTLWTPLTPQTCNCLCCCCC